MRSFLVICTILILSACQQRKGAAIIMLSYQGSEIRKQFDTLYNYQQADSGVYKGLLEQALAISIDSLSGDTITQDVFSSMYLNAFTGRYDCVTTTVFRLPHGSISAAGVFILTPGDTIAPDHDFPITGGSGAYRDVFGRYTRKYRHGIYEVALRYYTSKIE